MIKFKKAFSLAEILIAVAIISVIATLGFSIAGKGIERAYDNYVYTGVSGISKAISDANLIGRGVNENRRFFFEHIRNLLSATNPNALNMNEILAPNNIRYSFERTGTTDSGGSIYTITMTTPARKGTNRVYRLTYIADNQFNHLIIPEAPLDTRMDLLPYYIDNGFTGRTNGQNVYTPVTYNHFKNIYCSVNGGFDLPYEIDLINNGGGIQVNPDDDAVGARSIYTYDCRGIAQNQTGAIMLANPAKLRVF